MSNTTKVAAAGDLGAQVTRVIPDSDPLTTTRTYASEALEENGQGGSLLSTYLDRNKQRAAAGEIEATVESSHLAIVGLEDQLQALDTQPRLTSVVATALPLGEGLDDVPVSELGIQGNSPFKVNQTRPALVR